MPTREELKTLQALPLEIKIAKTKARIREWYQFYGGEVYVSFSGGKDSTVLLDLVRQDFPNVEAVFVDTGLEYPEIRDFVKTFENVTWLKPKMRFDEVIKKYGYPVVSKEISKIIYYYNKGSKWAKKAVANEYCDKKGKLSRCNITGKWKTLLDAPFGISNKCCDVIKKLPLHNFEKLSSKKAIIGTMASESKQREMGWLKTGCNTFGEKSNISKPLSFWTEQDVLQYIKQNNLPYCSIYGDIISAENFTEQESFCEMQDKLKCTGQQRTGCMFCMFGVYLEQEPNRFQRMKITHPKQYDYCINNLGLGEVLDYIKVEY